MHHHRTLLNAKYLSLGGPRAINRPGENYRSWGLSGCQGPSASHEGGAGPGPNIWSRSGVPTDRDSPPRSRYDISLSNPAICRRTSTTPRSSPIANNRIQLHSIKAEFKSKRLQSTFKRCGSSAKGASHEDTPTTSPRPRSVG